MELEGESSDNYAEAEDTNPATAGDQSAGAIPMHTTNGGSSRGTGPPHPSVPRASTFKGRPRKAREPPTVTQQDTRGGVCRPQRSGKVCVPPKRVEDQKLLKVAPGNPESEPQRQVEFRRLLT